METDGTNAWDLTEDIWTTASTTPVLPTVTSITTAAQLHELFGNPYTVPVEEQWQTTWTPPIDQRGYIVHEYDWYVPPAVSLRWIDYSIYRVDDHIYSCINTEAKPKKTKVNWKKEGF